MITPERFALLPIQNQILLQPECPVYVHCFRQCTERRSGTAFVQVRMVNRSERCIKSVILSAQASCGETVMFRREELFLAECNALPGAVFGEERMLSLGKCNAPSLCFTVERVIFADGMVWRKLPGQRLQTAEESGWSRCSCAMPNPPQASVCALCGKPIAAAPAAQEETEPEFVEPMPQESIAVLESVPEAMPVYATVGASEERPMPIVRTEPVYFPNAQAYCEEEEYSEKRWPSVLLCIVCVLALLVALGFLAYCLSDYMGWNLFDF